MKYKTILACGVVATLGAVTSGNAQPASINGTYDSAFGSALNIQGDATGFGQTYSELDAGYGLIAGGDLYLFFSGNLQNNGNNINLFFAGAGGQSTLNAADTGNQGANDLSDMNGSKFSPGFLATYGFNINNNGTALTVSQYNLLNNTAVNSFGTLTTSGGIVANATVDNSVVVGFNNNNAASQAANVGAGSTGLELAIPLSLLGNPSGPIEFLIDVNGSSEGYLSNQFLPGLPSGTGNLGGGGTGYGPGGGIFDFSSTAGEYLVVPEPSTLGLSVLSGLATLVAIRRRK